MYVCIYTSWRAVQVCAGCISHMISLFVCLCLCVYSGGKTNRMRLKLERLKLESHHHLKHLEMLERELAQWGKIKIYKIKI